MFDLSTFWVGKHIVFCSSNPSLCWIYHFISQSGGKTADAKVGVAGHGAVEEDKVAQVGVAGHGAVEEYEE